MRIAALQYANGQVKQCDELIDSLFVFAVNLELLLCVLNLSSTWTHCENAILLI